MGHIQEDASVDIPPLPLPSNFSTEVSYGFTCVENSGSTNDDVDLEVVLKKEEILDDTENKGQQGDSLQEENALTLLRTHMVEIETQYQNREQEMSEIICRLENFLQEQRDEYEALLKQHATQIEQLQAEGGKRRIDAGTAKMMRKYQRLCKVSKFEIVYGDLLRLYQRKRGLFNQRRGRRILLLPSLRTARTSMVILHSKYQNALNACRTLKDADVQLQYTSKNLDKLSLKYNRMVQKVRNLQDEKSKMEESYRISVEDRSRLQTVVETSGMQMEKEKRRNANLAAELKATKIALEKSRIDLEMERHKMDDVVLFLTSSIEACGKGSGRNSVNLTSDTAQTNSVDTWNQMYEEICNLKEKSGKKYVTEKEVRILKSMRKRIECAHSGIDVVDLGWEERESILRHLLQRLNV